MGFMVFLYTHIMDFDHSHPLLYLLIFSSSPLLPFISLNINLSFFSLNYLQHMRQSTLVFVRLALFYLISGTFHFLV